jgi:lipopolysaccharide biosynthesis glycosyltransferase
MGLDKMRQEGLAKRLLNTAKSYGKRLKIFDLDALNPTCNHILSLPSEYCVLETVCEAESAGRTPKSSWQSDHYSINDLENAKVNTKIIHYAGPLGKPWRRANQPSYYKQALRNVPATLNRSSIRDIRKYWSSQVATALRRIIKP